jgi:hypothetical protein
VSDNWTAQSVVCHNESMKSALKKSKWIFQAIKPQTLFFALTISLFLFARPVFAESWNAWFQSQFSLKTIFYAGICEIVGCGLGETPAKADSGSSAPAITYNRNSNQLGGVLGFSTNAMVAMYNNPPTSSQYYLANLGREFGIDTVNAQVSGSGAGMIRPVEQLWQILRNVFLSFLYSYFCGYRIYDHASTKT